MAPFGENTYTLLARHRKWGARAQEHPATAAKGADLPWSFLRALGALGQLEPSPGHLEQQRLVIGVGRVLRDADTFQGVALVLLHPRHTCRPEIQHPQQDTATLVPVRRPRQIAELSGSASRLRCGGSEPVGTAPMLTAAECRTHAEQCERLARDGPPEHQAVTLAIARAWRRVAEDIERRENSEGRT